jgi:hypothetical protein
MTTNQQQSYLFEALNKWRDAARDEIGGPYAGRIPGTVKPMEVRRAEAKIEQLQRRITTWENKTSRAHKSALRVIDNKYAEGRKRILFGEPKDALDFIDSL